MTLATRIGEVFRAQDTKLNRDIAIKVLPEVLTREIPLVAGFIPPWPARRPSYLT
jgi:hypothetical protein